MQAKLTAALLFAAGFGAGFAASHWLGDRGRDELDGQALPSTRLLLSAADTSAPPHAVVTAVVVRTVEVPVAAPDPEAMAWTPPPAEPGSEPRPSGGREGGRPDWFSPARMAEFTNEWARRAAVSRSNFIERAELKEDEVARFDVVVASMNIRLGNVLDPLIADLQAGLPITPEDRAHLVNELSEVVVLTYDELARGLPDAPVSQVSSNPLNVVQFADPRYVPFLRGFSSRRSWGGGGGGGGGPPPTGAR